MLRSYALAPDTLRRFMRRTFWHFQLITALSFLAFGLYLAFLAGPIDWRFAGPLISIVVLAFFVVIFFSYRQQLRLLYSVRYEIDGSSLIYRQHGQEPLRISRADITQITERPDGLWVETTDSRIHMLIPPGLARDGYVDILSTLQSWKGVDPPPTRSGPRGMLLLFGLISSLLVLLFANTLWLIVPIGLFILFFGLYAERRLTQIREVTPGIQRMYSMAFSFVFFIIVAKSCLLGFEMLAR